MSHKTQVDYCLWVKKTFPEYFKNKKVIDFGSLDINGNNKVFFENCEYLGLDIAPGKNVDIVSTAHEYQGPENYFDVVVSTEMFEHDQFLSNSLPNMIRVLKSGGLFFFTCAGPGRHEHGTRRTEPSASPFTSSIDGWGDYYKNVDESMVRNIIPVDEIFSNYKFNYVPTDLQFYGIKR